MHVRSFRIQLLDDTLVAMSLAGGMVNHLRSYAKVRVVSALIILRKLCFNGYNVECVSIRSISNSPSLLYVRSPVQEALYSVSTVYPT